MNVSPEAEIRTLNESLNELLQLAEQSRAILYCAVNSAEDIARQNNLLAAAYRLAEQLEHEANEAQRLQHY